MFANIFSKIKGNHRGQGLVELIVAIAVIEIGLFGVWSLFLVNFNTEREAELRIVGVNLAREGVEVVRNIRDSNWLKRKLNETDNGQIINWDNGLAAGQYSVNYDSSELDDYSAEPLRFNPNNYYVDSLLATGNQTAFTRKIILKDICCDDGDNNLVCDSIVYTVGSSCNSDLKIGINVVAEVSWSISGQSRHVVIEDNLYDWQ
jgi:hypothetical protein